MRSALHNWFLRCAALLIFISGGALARAVVQEIETHFVPVERPIHQQYATALNLEVRIPVPVQLEGTGLLVQPAPLDMRQTQIIFVWLEVVGTAEVLRAFDALAPPQ
jgi:hypothetical protein